MSIAPHCRRGASLADGAPCMPLRYRVSPWGTRTEGAERLSVSGHVQPGCRDGAGNRPKSASRTVAPGRPPRHEVPPCWVGLAAQRNLEADFGDSLLRPSILVPHGPVSVGVASQGLAGMEDRRLLSRWWFSDLVQNKSFWSSGRPRSKNMGVIPPFRMGSPHPPKICIEPNH